MISVSKIFEILPGHGLELCNMSHISARYTFCK